MDDEFIDGILEAEDNVLRIELGVRQSDNVPVILLVLGDRFVELDPDSARQVSLGLQQTSDMVEDFSDTIVGMDDEEVNAEVELLRFRMSAPDN